MHGPCWRFMAEEEIHPFLREPHPFDGSLALGFGADDFEEAVAHGLGRSFEVNSAASGKQAGQLAALVEPVLSRLSHGLLEGIDQRLGGFVRAHGQSFSENPKLQYRNPRQNSNIEILDEKRNS